jgi:putative component of toxin-antitoxin plasmid stabilization module
VRDCPRWLDRVETTVYTPPVFELVKSATFDAWFGGLRDVRARVLVVVLAGGDKRTQRIDIKTALRIAAEWERGP